jgi:hypothetical protein
MELPARGCPTDGTAEGSLVDSLTITLLSGPNELVATPLPAALPLFVTGLGALGLLGW